jgi:hypothetical protein
MALYRHFTVKIPGTYKKSLYMTELPKYEYALNKVCALLVTSRNMKTIAKYFSLGEMHNYLAFFL